MPTKTCEDCHGTGCNDQVCTECEGRKFVVTCDVCDVTGWVRGMEHPHECHVCGGTRYVTPYGSHTRDDEDAFDCPECTGVAPTTCETCGGAAVVDALTGSQLKRISVSRLLSALQAWETERPDPQLRLFT